jgi:acylphosphatase
MGQTGKNVARKFLISGRVQGVGYRFFAERWANQLGLRGYVKNLWDGSVEVYAIGEARLLDQLRLHLAEGPPSARISGIAESEEAIKGKYAEFFIESGW